MLKPDTFLAGVSLLSIVLLTFLLKVMSRSVFFYAYPKDVCSLGSGEHINYNKESMTWNSVLTVYIYNYIYMYIIYIQELQGNHPHYVNIGSRMIPKLSQFSVS
jgi:hypothetical protein